jgi:hypothetical protein
MSPFKEWMVRVVLLLMPVGLVAIALPQLVDGLALEGAYPAPVYLLMNAPETQREYADAATSLDFGVQADGDRAIAEAEIISLAGGQRQRVKDLLIQGLSRSPASARGWTLLGEQLLSEDRRKAANDISIALELAPSNFLLSGRLLRDSGEVWDLLPGDSRQVAVNMAPNLWNQVDLHQYLRAVLATRGGVQMMTEAYRDAPEDLRALNRFVAAERLKDQSQP